MIHKACTDARQTAEINKMSLGHRKKGSLRTEGTPEGPT